MPTPSTPTICIERDPSLTVAVPVYNNAGSLPALHSRLLSALGDMGSAFEIIYVNDASTDESFEVLSYLHATDDRVTVVDLAENAGQSAAILAALGFARGEIVVTIDADLENHPEDIPALVAAIRNGADLACGVRQRRTTPALTRGGPSMLANRLVGRALGIDLDDWGCGLNAVTAEVVAQLLAANPLPLLPKIEAALQSSRIAQVPVGYSERAHGQSGYTVRRLAAFAATFLREFSISRSLRRLVGGTALDTGTLGGAGHSAERSVAADFVRTITALAAWAVLTGAALIARAWRWLAPPSGAEPFRIREVRRSQGPGFPEPSLGACAPRNRPDDIVAHGG
jgi:Glycosyl transferase family 2